MTSLSLFRWLSGKESAYQEGNISSIPGSGHSSIPGVGNATHSSILAREIPGTEEPSRLWSMGLQKNQTRLTD